MFDVLDSGMDAEFDGAVAETRRVEAELDRYLETQKAELGCKVRAHEQCDALPVNGKGGSTFSSGQKLSISDWVLSSSVTRLCM